MTAQGFHEAQAVFLSDAEGFVGQVRRFGSDGPAYEVLAVAGHGNVTIEVVETGEQLDYAIEELVRDPMAETVP